MERLKGKTVIVTGGAGGIGRAAWSCSPPRARGSSLPTSAKRPDVNATKVGCQAWMREQYGLGGKDVVNAVREIVK